MDPIVNLTTFGLPALAAVLGASVVGSAHCVGMCGPLAAHVSRSHWENALYNLGRMTSYALIGLLLGYMGERLLAVNQPWAPKFAATLMVGFVLLSSWSIYRGRPLTVYLPRFLSHALGRAAHSRGSLTKTFGAGFLTAFLPCGWLYSFAAVAAVTGAATSGALVMVAFWLGTLPVMTAAPILGRKWLAPLGNKYPGALALILCLSSLLVIGMRFVSQAHSCH